MHDGLLFQPQSIRHLIFPHNRDTTKYYEVRIDGGGVLQLNYYNGTSSSTVINQTWTFDRSPHNIRVERKAGGKWKLFFDGIQKGSETTENSLTSVDQVVALLRIYYAGGYFDNILIYRLADKWARDRGLMVEDLYNFSGTADVWDGRILWVDENTLLVPARCCDVNNVLAVTDLTCLSWPNLMPDNTDYDATKHNMVADGDKGKSGTTDWTATNCTLAKDTATKKFGTQSLQLTHDGSATTVMSAHQDITGLTAGDDYWIKTWLLQGGATAGHLKIWSGTAGTPETTALVDVSFDHGQWDSLESCVEVQPGHTVLRIKAEFDVASAGVETANVDWTYQHKNLVDNGGMEGTYVSGLAPGWTKVGTPTLAEEATIVHSGSKSQKITASGNDQGISEILSLTAAKWYSISLWMFIESGKPDFHLRDATNDTRWYVSQPNSLSVGVWQKHTVTAYSSITNPTLYIQSTSATDIFYIDDVHIQELDSASPSVNVPATEADSYEVGVV